MAGSRLTAILLFLAAAAPPVLAETYKWVDDKGVVNYSNAPPAAKAAKPQLIEERISTIAPDPSLGPAIAAMNARAARRAAYEEADYARRQGYMLAAQASYAGSYCPYGADCGMDYASPAYYYPYAYGGAIFYARSARQFPPHIMHHRASFPSGGRGAMHAGGRGAMHAGGRGSFR